MRREAVLALSLLLLVPAGAKAASVSDELTLGATRETASSPNTKFWGDRLSGSAEVSERWSVQLGAMVTHYGATTASTAETVWQLSGGALFEMDDHWSFGAAGQLSPNSTGSLWVPTVLDVGTLAPASVEVRSQTKSYGFDLSSEWESAGHDETPDAETIVDVFLGGTHYSIAQAIPRVRTQSGAELTTNELRASCNAIECGPAIRSILAKDQSSLWQLRASVAVTETLYDDTDLDLSATYFVYTTDPSKIGLYSVGTFSRTPIGEGLPTLPLRYTVRPAVEQRFGPIGIEPSFQYGHYVDDEGHALTYGLRVNAKPSRPVKLWIGGTLQSDADGQGNTAWMAWATLGARVRF
jgi:hypothetical protein